MPTPGGGADGRQQLVLVVHVLEVGQRLDQLSPQPIGEPRRIRWTPHALTNLVDREINRREAEAAISGPDSVSPGRPPRLVYLRLYFDAILLQQM